MAAALWRIIRIEREVERRIGPPPSFDHVIVAVLCTARGRNRRGPHVSGRPPLYDRYTTVIWPLYGRYMPACLGEVAAARAHPPSIILCQDE